MRRLPTLSALVAALVVSTGCMTTITPAGKQIRVGSEKERNESCEFITIVTASNSMGFTTGQDVESVMNELRNKVAAAGGNAMRILTANTTGNWFEGTSSQGAAEALRCK